MDNRQSSKNLDPRILKTKRVLCKAFIDLMEEKTIDEITVLEICKTADINRMTFYKHYSDKYDLLDDCMKIIEEYIVDEINKISDVYSDPADFCIKLMDVVVSVCEEKRCLLKKLTLQNNAIAAGIISESVQASVEKLMTIVRKNKPTAIPKKYAAAFITGGATKAIFNWLPNRESYPKEKLVADLTPIIIKIINDDSIFA